VHNFLTSRVFVFLIIPVFLLTSCSGATDAVPEGVIKPDKMTEIFVDMQITESVLVHVQQKGINANDYRKSLYDKIFEKHKISKSEFDSSFSYYSNNNIKLLDKIYAEVITSLNQHQSKIKIQ